MASQPAPAARFRRNEKVEEAPLQEELMLFEPESARFFVLNRTMAFLWRRCDGKHALSSIVAEMSESFEDVEPAAAQADVERAAAELVSLGLITVDAPSASS